MAYFQYAVACAFVIFLCVQQGYSISCFQCNSRNDSGCLTDVPPDGFRKECPPDTKDVKYILCRKIKQVIDFEVNGLQPETRIIRSCGSYNTTLANHCYQRSGFGGRQEVCACNDKDYCNTSTSLIASSALLLAFYALLKICH